jgi:hypothetical protein
MLYIRIAEYYHLRLGLSTKQISEIPLNRLMRLLPILKKKEDWESKQIIVDAGGLIGDDFDGLIKDNGWQPLRPVVSKDKENGLYNITFYKDSTNKIYELSDGLVWNNHAQPKNETRE